MKLTCQDKLSIDGAMTQIQAMLKKHGTIEITVTGGKRKLTQNALSHEWYGQIAKHLGDHTTEEVRAISKLHIGVPMLRAEDSEFHEAYDKVVKPLAYEDKLQVMEFWPVTSRMKKEQMSRYLDEMQRFWAQRCGIVLESKETQ